MSHPHFGIDDVEPVSRADLNNEDDREVTLNNLTCLFLWTVECLVQLLAISIVLGDRIACILQVFQTGAGIARQFWKSFLSCNIWCIELHTGVVRAETCDA